MIRFAPSRLYLTSAAVALGLAVFTGWWALTWLPAIIASVLFVASAALVLVLALQPIIEIHPTHLAIGKREILWRQVRRVDQTGWVAPLVAYLTLADDSKLRLIYPGDMESANRLLGLIQQRSYAALINGVPYRQIFGDPVPAAKKSLPSPRYRVLTEQDEAEVERLYQQLKTAGHFDSEK